VGRRSTPPSTAIPSTAAGLSVEVSTAPVGGDLVTVAVPARNEEGYIARCLQSIVRQTAGNLQVVVVDGGSADATVEIVQGLAARDPRIELVANPTATIPSSMNLALTAAKGKWFVRVDAHSEVPPHYVAHAVDRLRTGRWGGVGGRKNGVGVTNAGRAIAAAMGSRFGVGNSLYHYGTTPQLVDHIPFGAYPTDLLREMGGWDERLAANEDFELDYRLTHKGHDLLFDPELVIEWECRQSIADLFRQYRRYGRAKVAVARLHPASVRPRHLAAPLLAATLAGAAILGVRKARLGSLVASPYLLGLTAASVVTGRRVHGTKAKAWVPGAFLAMHLGWGLGFWEGLLAERRDRGRTSRT
jgi:succinoglycan biosynthesis protein ExoA